jgi:hypothetical protein
VSWQSRLTTFGPRSRSSNPAIKMIMGAQMSCTRRHPRTTRTDTEGHGGCEGRIVDLGAELFAMSAAVVYAQTAMREPPSGVIRFVAPYHPATIGHGPLPRRGDSDGYRR